MARYNSGDISESTRESLENIIISLQEICRRQGINFESEVLRLEKDLSKLSNEQPLKRERIAMGFGRN